MKKRLWVLCSVLLAVLILLLACTSGATPTPAPTTKPTSSPTAKPTATPSPTPSPTAKPTATGAPLSFAGKTVTIVTPVAAGGGTDSTARIYARFLPRFLPGKPDAVVKNMPGGGSTIGSNYVWGAKPDGLAVLVSSTSARQASVYGSPAAKYDLHKMPVAIAVQGGRIIYMAPGIISKPEDVPKARGLKFGHTPGGVSFVFIILKELMDIPTEKVTTAYSGTGPAWQALLSGEINVSGDSIAGYISLDRGAYVKKGELMNLFQSGIHDASGKVIRDSTLPDVLTGQELYEKVLGKPPSGMGWRAYNMIVALSSSYDHMMHLPPGTPDSIVRAYWDAAGQMLKDREFIEIMGRLNMKLTAGEPAEKGFKTVLGGIDSSVVDWLKDVLAKKYGIVLE